jgi:hypothetical protein
LLAGMDLSLWPRVRKLFVDWEYRGLEERASSLGLELEKDPCPAGAEPASCQAKDYEENPRVSEAWVYLGMLRLSVKGLARAA